MKFFKYLMPLVMSFSLLACGGGGGSSGANTGEQVLPIKVGSPATVTVAPGAAVKYAVSGGERPYSAISDNASIIKVAVDQNNFLIIGGVHEGTSKVQVFDAKLNAVEITVNVSSGPVVSLYTTAPNSLTMGPSSKQKFTIGGGMAPYLVVSDRLSVATALVNGFDLEITSISVGVANIKITDALGASLLLSVTVAGDGGLLAVTPSSASAYVNTLVEVAITGGVAPYRVAGGIPSAVQASISGNKLIVNPLLVSSKLDISILDSQNQSAKFTLDVISGQPTIRLSPSSLTISEQQSQNIDLTVFGATGVVTAFSSDMTLLSANISGTTVSLSRLKCVATNTDVTITVVDANRAIASAVVTVRDNGNGGSANCP